MRLIKYLSPRGEAAVGQLDAGRVIPLDLSSSSFQTLAELLEADDPAQVVRGLLDPDRAIAAPQEAERQE
jgi:hypothetical protein